MPDLGFKVPKRFRGRHQNVRKSSIWSDAMWNTCDWNHIWELDEQILDKWKPWKRLGPNPFVDDPMKRRDIERNFSNPKHLYAYHCVHEAAKFFYWAANSPDHLKAMLYRHVLSTCARGLGEILEIKDEVLKTPVYEACYSFYGIVANLQWLLAVSKKKLSTYEKQE